MKKKLFLILTSTFFYPHLHSMNPVAMFKTPDERSLYVINGHIKKWNETTPIERTLYLFECKKKGWGYIYEGYEEWKKHQDSETLEALMRSPTNEFYYFVFWTRNIDFIKDFISKAPHTMNLLPGFYEILQTDNPHIVEFLIKEKKLNYTELMYKEFGYLFSAWTVALKYPPQCKNLRVIYEYDKQEGGKNIKYFSSSIQSFLRRYCFGHKEDLYKEEFNFVEQ